MLTAAGFLGPTGIGYDDSDDATVLSDMRYNYITVYMRYSFNVDLPADVSGLDFTVDYDDGFVAYINGQEVARRGVSAGQTKDTPASSHEASAGSGGNPPEMIDLSAHVSKLLAGENVFAIEVHNATLDSSDLSMIPSLVMFGGMLPPHSDIRLNKTILDFGNINTGQTVDRSFDIQNAGTLPLEVNTLTLTGLSPDSFSILSPAILPLTVAPAGVRTVSVQYRPTAPGDHQYTAIAVGSDDSDEPVVSVELIAQGGPEPLYALRQAGSVGGAANVVAEYGSNILLAQGATLAVIDISDPANPTALKQTRLANRIEAIAVQGDIAYIAAGSSGLLVVKLNTIPSLIDPIQFDTPGNANDVFCQGNYLCVADGIGGMQLYDISAPAIPSLLGTYATAGHAKAVRISGDTAYLLDEKMMTVIPLNSLPLTPQYVFDEVEFGQTLEISAVAAYISDTLGGFFVVDITGPPALLGQVRPQAGVAYGMDVINSYAYLPAPGGLEVIDVSNDANPTSLLVLPLTGQPSDVAAVGTTLCLANGPGGLLTLDFSSPTEPVQVGTYRSQALPVALAATTSGEVYTAQGGAGLVTLDLSDTLNPEQMRLLENLANARDVAISGQYAYIARGLEGMQIFDISQPSSPVLKGTFSTDGFCSSVACSGSIAVLADGNTVYAVNVSQPTAPVLLNQWTGSGWFFDVAINGTMIYAVAGGMGLQVYDVGSANPIGSYPTDAMAYGIALSGDTAYVACGSEGLQILDISTPSLPSLLGVFDTTGIAMDVAVSGPRVCLAEAGFGVTVIDVSNPASPVLYARSALPQNSLGILAADSRIFVANEKDGLAVLAVTAWPANPPADINNNLLVDMADLVQMADHWLMVEADLSVLPGNLYYYDTTVNLQDFSALSEF